MTRYAKYQITLIALTVPDMNIWGNRRALQECLSQIQKPRKIQPNMQFVGMCLQRCSPNTISSLRFVLWTSLRFVQHVAPRHVQHFVAHERGSQPLRFVHVKTICQQKAVCDGSESRFAGRAWRIVRQHRHGTQWIRKSSRRRKMATLVWAENGHSS